MVVCARKAPSPLGARHDCDRPPRETRWRNASHGGHIPRRANSLQTVSDELRACGVAVWDDALDTATGLTIRIDVLALHNRGRFRLAGVGRTRTVRPEIRSDEVCWLLPEEADDGGAFGNSPGLGMLRDLLTNVGAFMSKDVFVRLGSLEMFASHYPAGAFYAPHVDRFAGSNERILTFVYFLNPGWTKEHGGELRIFGDAPQTIEPRQGRLVLFHTPELLHEVLKTSHCRFALTGWLGTRTVV